MKCLVSNTLYTGLNAKFAQNEKALISYYLINANLLTCYYIDWRLNHLSIVLEVEIVVIRELRSLWFEANTTRLVLLKILETYKTVEAPAIQ